MHDWILLSLKLDWETGELELQFKTRSGSPVLRAQGVRDLKVPRIEEWGPSVSVNGIEQFAPTDQALAGLRIKMQTGDVIEIVAQLIQMPPNYLEPVWLA